MPWTAFRVLGKRDMEEEKAERGRTAILRLVPTQSKQLTSNILSHRSTPSAPQKIQAYVYAPIGLASGAISAYYQRGIVPLLLVLALLVTILAMIDRSQQGAAPAPKLLLEDMAWTLLPAAVGWQGWRFASALWRRRKGSAA